VISFRGAAKAFPGARGSGVLAVDHVDLDIEDGEITGVIGYSGAGKSTLVRMINALELPTAGTVTVGGRVTGELGERGLRELRSEVGMIFQQFNLFSSRTVAGNVGYPLRIAGWPRERRRQRVAELLEFVGISDKARQFPHQLSGGQKQRVGIARALATSPRILLADEATSALDPETTLDVLALLKRINRELGTTIVVITHEMEVVSSICDKVAVMEQGRVIEHGPVYDVFADPQQEARGGSCTACCTTARPSRPSPGCGSTSPVGWSPSGCATTPVHVLPCQGRSPRVTCTARSSTAGSASWPRSRSGASPSNSPATTTQSTHWSPASPPTPASRRSPRRRHRDRRRTFPRGDGIVTADARSPAEAES